MLVARGVLAVFPLRTALPATGAATAMSGAGLVFDADTHTYWMHGHQLPGVTDILKAQRIVSVEGIPPARLEMARQRGKAVHYAIRLIHEGSLDPATVAPALDPFLFAYEQFRESTGFMPDRFEEPLAHPLGFAGTPDAAGPVMGVPAVVDFKVVATLDLAYGVQLAAYRILLGANLYEVRKRYLVQLKDDGTFHLEECRDPGDEAEFRSALHLYQRRLKRNGGTP